MGGPMLMEAEAFAQKFYPPTVFRGMRNAAVRHKENLELMKEFGFTFTMPCPGMMHGSEGVPVSRSGQVSGNAFSGAEFMKCTYADCAAGIVAEVEQKKHLGG